MSSAIRSPRFIMAQNGARRAYAVPLILHQAGLLEHFFTDVAGNAGWGKWLSWGNTLPWIGPKLKRLLNRQIPEPIRHLTRSFAKPNIRWFISDLLCKKDASNAFRLDVQRNLELGLAVANERFPNVTHLYLMLSEFTPLMRIARERGIKVISEVYILISSNRILAEERRRFPGWEQEPPDWHGILSEFGFQGAPLQYVDFYICPSERVASDLIENWQISPSSVTVVPYGMKPEWLEVEPKPQPGRILFVGTAELRKGIHYLAMAAEELKRRGRNYEFRIAGQVEASILNQPICRNLTFLGRIPRDRIKDEYQLADVFVLPSLAEGSAEVTYEALACAIPLVTTDAAGSVARNGVEGIIVPERDPQGIADAIELIVEDRSLRARLSFAARERATNFTWNQYGIRLINTLTEICK